MPNWCTNNLTITGPKATIAAIAAATKATEGAFDFNGIVPMPASLNITCGSAPDWGEDILFGNWKSMLSMPVWRQRIEEATAGSVPSNREEMIALVERVNGEPGHPLARCVDLDTARKARANFEAYGFRNWYDWSLHNWGTKWNANVAQMDVSDNSIVGVFDTAWAPPIAVVKALGEKYPDVKVSMSYVEEGNGFAGVATVENGVCTDQQTECDVEWMCAGSD